MNVRRRRFVTGVSALVIAGAAAGTGLALTGGDDQPLGGSTYDRAVEAALDFTHGGTVTEADSGDDGAAYDVEIRLDDGTQVDVQLDRDFAVIAGAADDDSSGNSGDQADQAR